MLFLGTPGFALPSLRALSALSPGVRIVGVVTQPDRPAGRGRRLTPPPVAEAARDMGLRLLQPESLRDEAVLRELASMAPDLLAVVAYGRLVPPALLRLPRLGSINLHPSLLPAYRGAAPIQRAIAAGEARTGVTVMYLSEELDAGDIILQGEVEISPEESAGELELRLADLGAALMGEAVGLIAAGKAPRRPQEHSLATYAPKLTKQDGELRWERHAGDLVNLVRAANPRPGAYTTWKGGVLKVWRARLWEEREGYAPPGTVLSVSEGGIGVAAGSGTVLLTEVQAEGGRRMATAEFQRGHPILAGEMLG